MDPQLERMLTTVASMLTPLVLVIYCVVFYYLFRLVRYVYASVTDRLYVQRRSIINESMGKGSVEVCDSEEEEK